MRSGSTRCRAPSSRVTPSTIEPRGAGAGDPRAHLVEAVGDVADLGLARGVLDHRRRRCASAAAISAVWVPPTVTLGNLISPPFRPFLARGDDIAAVDLDLGAELLQRHDEQVDRPRADGAAARQRHLAPRPCARAAARSPRSSRASWRRDRRARWCRRCARRRCAWCGRAPATRPARLPGTIMSTPWLERMRCSRLTSARRGTLSRISV